MDYNKKGVKWYWWTLLTLYTAGVIYWLLWSAPYLYSKTEFQKALIGRKSNTPQTFTITNSVNAEGDFFQEKHARLLWSYERTGVDPNEVTRNRKFIEESSLVLALPEGFEPQEWAFDSRGLVMVSTRGHIAAFDWEGALLWRFTPPEEIKLFRPLLLTQQVIVATRKGHIYSFGRDDGQLQWFIPLAQEIFSEPILLGKSFLIAIRPWTREITHEQQVQPTRDEATDDLSPGLAEVDLISGRWLKISEPLPFTKEVDWSKKDQNTLYLTQDRSLLHIDLATLSLKKKKDFEADIVSPVMILPKMLIVPTRDGRVFGLDHDFDLEYEYDLGQALNIPPIYVPLHDRIALITDNGYLHVITATKGERKWRFNLQNENLSSLGWTSRLNGKHIEQLNLRWIYKGWSLWLPCVTNRICIYNPAEGQIIDRIILPGSYAGVPYIQEKTFHFILKQDKQWKISRFIERVLAEREPPKETPKDPPQE